MKRLLLSASLIGVVFAGYPPSPQFTQTALSEAEPLGAALAAAPHSGGVSERAKSKPSGFQRVALSSGSAGTQGRQVESVDDLFTAALPARAKGAPQSATDGAPLPDDSALWVRVTRGAWMHSGPSVSSKVVGHQPPGKEMPLLESRQGWYQVSDPETGQLGWIFAKYYLDPIDRPSEKRVAAREPEAPVKAQPVVAATPAAVTPPKAVRRVLEQPRFLAPPQVATERPAAPPPHRGEGVAALLDRAFRR
jgi:hypothetical protein